MIFYKNKVQLYGALGQDPKIKTTETGRRMAKFSLAINDSYMNKGGEKITSTEWFQVIAWGKQADEVEQLMKKGSIIALNGKLVNQSHTDSEGKKRHHIYIVAFRFTLIKIRENPATSQPDEKREPLSDDEVIAMLLESQEKFSQIHVVSNP